MGQEVPTRRKRILRLVEVATNKCVQNVNKLQDVGGTPFHLLRPVLMKMSAKQLNQIELQSPQIMPFSDELWPALIEREFPDRPPISKGKMRQSQEMPNKTLFYRYDKERELLRNDSAQRLRKMTEKLKKEKSANSIVSVSHVLRDPTVKRRRNYSDGYTRSTPSAKKNSILLKARKDLQNRSLMFPGYSQKVKSHDPYDAFNHIEILPPRAASGQTRNKPSSFNAQQKRRPVSTSIQPSSQSKREKREIPSSTNSDHSSNEKVLLQSFNSVASSSPKKRKPEPSIFLKGKRPRGPRLEPKIINNSHNLQTVSTNDRSSIPVKVKKS
ncbi:uncharacterized protein PRCAT00005535001 [Priceomyces carsonii]|uniref:uncharacterized protein n=1 Tax=Priceomyces carsonii TaxID=28549 RepID=UPI002ED92FB4|nr:unnamed protein product [Priceomyces carsonii]